MVVPGTPMQKIVPPRLVGPYLTGQRDVLAGYVYRAEDLAFTDPAEAFRELGLGFEGSGFTPRTLEYHVIRWPARSADGYQPGPGLGGRELYLDPVPIPAGAALFLVRAGTDQLIAEFDGLAWQRAEA